MVKKFSLNLKEPHLEAISDLKKKFSLSSNKEMVSQCIKSALNMKQNDLIFSTIKEKCSGGCFASEPHFEIEMNEDIFIQQFVPIVEKMNLLEESEKGKD